MEEVRLPIGKVGASEDEVYYMFQNNENEVLFYVLNKGVYSLNLRDLPISKEMMDMFPPDAQIPGYGERCTGKYLDCRG